MHWISIVFLAIVVGPFAIIYGSQFLVFPLALYRRHTMPLRPERVPTAIENLTPEAQSYFSRLIQDAQAEGFKVLANVFTANVAKGTDSAMLLMTHPAYGDSILALATSGPNIRSFGYAIGTEYRDGQRWITSSLNSPTIFPANPVSHALTCAWCPPISQAHVFHRRRLAEAGRNNQMPVTPPDDEAGAITYLNRITEFEYEWAARCGYLAADKRRGIWRFTLKGACFSAWRLLPPLKSMRERIRDRRARRAWQHLDMGEPPASNTLADNSEVPIATQAMIEASSTSAVMYSTDAGPNEIRFVGDDAGLTVKIGRMSLRRFIARYAIGIGFLAIMAIASVYFIRNAYYVSQLVGGSVFQYLPFWTNFTLFFGLIEAGNLMNCWRLGRRRITLRASHAGLAWDNVPSKPSQGESARANVAHLQLVLMITVTSYRYRLLLRRSDKPAVVVLIDCLTFQQAKELRERLLQAMGITIPIA